MLTDLPDKFENVLTVKLEGEQRKLYAAHEQRLRATLTKASDMIYVLCRKIGEDLKSMKPSYLIDRIKNIFPDIRTEEYDVDGQMPETAAGALRYIIRHSDDAEAGETLDAVRKLLSKMGYGRQLRSINFGQNYVNSSKNLSPDTVRLIYGENLVESVSKLERYAECQFKYFLTYGLFAQREGDIQG